MLMAEVVEYLARLHDPRVDYPIEDIEPCPSRLHEPVMAKEREVLREVRLGELRDLEHLFDGKLPFLEEIEDLEPLGIGQYLVDMGVPMICLLRKG
jgi:hypothetical protein